MSEADFSKQGQENRREKEPFYPQTGVAVTCRSFREYEAMFALDGDALANGPTLDVAGGASSFAAEARSRGASVMSADPRYAKPPETLYAESLEEIATSAAKLERAKDRFDWTYYGSIQAHRANREQSLEKFIADYRAETDAAGGAYVAASLPKLPFVDETFALTLCSHFLFLYEEQFSYEFHRDALTELYRVTRPGGEMRVYPLYTLKHERYPGLDDLMRELAAAGAEVGLLPSRLPFISGSTHLLRIGKPERR